MRYKSLLVPLGLLVLVWVPGDDARGQRGGRGGVAAGGRVSAGAAVGPYGGGGDGLAQQRHGDRPGRRLALGRQRQRFVHDRARHDGRLRRGRADRQATGGVTAGRGVGGVQVTTPGGQTATKVGTAGGVKGPGGYGAVGGRSVGATSGPYGTGVSAARGGAIAGPGGVAAGGSRAGAAIGPGGGVAAGAGHWGAAANPYGGYAAAGASRRRRRRRRRRGRCRALYQLPQRGRGRRPGRLRPRRLRRLQLLQRRLVRRPPRRLAGGRWNGNAYWRWAPYATLAGFCGYPATPVVYDYGANLVYDGNQVYYNAVPVATAADYAGQAQDIAVAGQVIMPPPTEEWQALGVFALVQADEKDANNIFQLAIDKEGVIRGNYYNALTDTTIPVSGSVDRKTQRAAWIVGEKKDIVYETGFGNLAQPETSALVHFGKERTQQMTLVRLEPPDMK